MRLFHASVAAVALHAATDGPRGWFALPLDAVQTAALAVLSGEPPPALTDVLPRIAPQPVFLAPPSTARAALQAV